MGVVIPCQCLQGRAASFVVCWDFLLNSDIFGAGHLFQKCITMLLFSMFPNKTSKIWSKIYFKSWVKLLKNSESV